MIAIQDRTGEFRAAVSSQLRIAGGAHMRAPDSPGTASATSHKSAFMVRASAVAKDIAETTAMLQRLAQLARRRAIFDDRPQEVDELTMVIKQKTSALTESIRALKPLAASAESSPSWGVSKREHEQLTQHSRRVLVSLEERVKDITGDFTEVLTARSKSIQASKSRTDQFLAPAYSQSGGGSSANLAAANNPLYRPPSRPSRAGTPPQNGTPRSPQSNSHSQAVSPGHSSAINASTAAYSENPYASSNPFAVGQESAHRDDVLMLPEQEQSQILLEDQQTSYLSSRSSAVDAIESTINELGSMFSQLSTMIAEQRETVQRIDANTEDISLSVSGAQRELLKYYARVSSNRWLMIKSFGVILFFFLLWVLIT